MSQSKTAKKYMILVFLFCVFAVVFALLYQLNIIETMSLYLSATYVTYFVGLAILYNGAYCKEKGSNSAKKLSYIFGTLIILLSIGLLIYGFATDQISMFN